MCFAEQREPEKPRSNTERKSVVGSNEAPKQKCHIGMMWHFCVLFMNDLRCSFEVEAVKVHHFVPRRDEVTHEFLFRIVLCIDLGECAQLRV